MGDDRFFALTYPAVLRQILYRVLGVEEFADVDGPLDDWRVQWLRFASNLPGIFPPPKATENDGDEDALESSQLEWIEDTVDAFCTHHKVLERFRHSQLGEAQQ